MESDVVCVGVGELAGERAGEGGERRRRWRRRRRRRIYLLGKGGCSGATVTRVKCECACVAQFVTSMKQQCVRDMCNVCA